MSLWQVLLVKEFWVTFLLTYLLTYLVGWLVKNLVVSHCFWLRQEVKNDRPSTRCSEFHQWLNPSSTNPPVLNCWVCPAPAVQYRTLSLKFVYYQNSRSIKTPRTSSCEFLCILKFPRLDVLVSLVINNLKPIKDGGGLKGFLPQLDEFYFTTAEKKILENCRCIVPNFMND